MSEIEAVGLHPTKKIRSNKLGCLTLPHYIVRKPEELKNLTNSGEYASDKLRGRTPPQEFEQAISRKR